MSQSTHTNVSITQIPAGETALSLAISTAVEERKLDIDPIKAALLEQAFGYLSTHNESIAEVAQHGPENLAMSLVVIAQHDVDTAIRCIKYIMRQLVQDAYYRYLTIQKRQMLAARANGGGVEGYDLPIGEILDAYGNYPGSEEEQFTPLEQVDAVKDMHAMLNGIYVVLQGLKFAWLANFKSTELPFYWYVDQNSQYHEFSDFESAVRYLDDRAVTKAEEKKSRIKDALKALKNLKIAS